MKDIWPGSGHSFPQHLTDVNGTLFLTANDGDHGHELWESDGTTAGTMLARDIWPGSGDSFPYWLTNVNGTAFFSADDGMCGRELGKAE